MNDETTIIEGEIVNEGGDTTALATRPGGSLAARRDMPLERNPAARYIARLNSPASRKTMQGALDKIAGIVSQGKLTALTFPWEKLTYSDAQIIRAALVERYAFSTCNKMLSALRQVVVEAWRLNMVSAEQKERVKAVENVTGQREPAGRSLSQGEITALLADCRKDDGTTGPRDGAIIALLYGCGLRRAEVVALDLENYDPESGALKVLGKRNKQRTVYVRNGAAAALNEWLALRGQDVERTSALFLPVNKGGAIQYQQTITRGARRGQIVPGRLSSQAVYNLCQKRADRASVKSFSPHDFRRTFVGDALDAGADIVTVQKMAGHASPTTTARYDRRDDRAKFEAAGLLHVPWSTRTGAA